MAAYQRACAEGQAPHYQGSIMAVGKSAAGKTSFKKRSTGGDLNEEHLVTNALETDLCTIDITNVTLAWEIHAKQRTDLLEDEITLKIKDFVKGQDVKKPIHTEDTEANLLPIAVRPLPPLPKATPAKSKKRASKLGNFLSRIGRRKKEDVNHNTQMTQDADDTAIDDTIATELGANSPPSSKPQVFLSPPVSLPGSNLPLSSLKPEDRFRLESIANIPGNQALTMTSKQDHSLIKVWDFGGQKVYYILHTVFLRVSCVYVLVIDLSTMGRANSQADAAISEAEFASFEYWLNMIMSHIRNDGKKVDKGNVIILGTHIDKLHEDRNEQRRLAESYFQELKGKLQTRQHKYLILSFFAVDNLSGDLETYEKIREALLDAVKANCHWGEMRPIRYLQMTQNLQLLREDNSISQLKGNLVPFSDVSEMAKKYNITTEEDVKAYLEYSHLVGDVTYFNTPELQDFVITNPHWLSSVFRAIITVDQFYPNDAFPGNEVHALSMLKNDGVLERKGPLLSLLWQPFIWEEEPLYVNLPSQTMDKQQQKTVVEYLLKLMFQFDLVVPLSDEYCLVPCLLPTSNKPLPQSFPKMGPVTIPLYLVFHSSLESHKAFQLSLSTGDEFLPHGFFHRLISRCVKQKWKWTGEKCRNVAYFLVDECRIRLSTKSTWIKIEAWFPAGSFAVPSKYYNEIKAAIDSLIDTYTPNMWVELCVNPCPELGEDCLQSIGITSLGGRAHLVTCEQHGRCLTINDFNVWLEAVKYQIAEESTTPHLTNPDKVKERVTHDILVLSNCPESQKEAVEHLTDKEVSVSKQCLFKNGSNAKPFVIKVGGRWQTLGDRRKLLNTLPPFYDINKYEIVTEHLLILVILIDIFLWSIGTHNLTVKLNLHKP